MFQFQYSLIKPDQVSNTTQWQQLQLLQKTSRKQQQRKRGSLAITLRSRYGTSFCCLPVSFSFWYEYVFIPFRPHGKRFAFSVTNSEKHHQELSKTPVIMPLVFMYQPNVVIVLLPILFLVLLQVVWISKTIYQGKNGKETELSPILLSKKRLSSVSFSRYSKRGIKRGLLDMVSWHVLSSATTTIS